MKHFLSGVILSLALFAVGAVVVARHAGISPQVVTCTVTSSFPCIGMPGTSSGMAVILTRADAGTPNLYLPTTSGDLTTRQEVAQMIAAAVPTPTPLPTPTPTPIPTPTPTPVPTPTPTPNPIALSPPSLNIVVAAGSNPNPDKFTVNVAAPGGWTASLANAAATPWMRLHCVTGNCGGSWFQVQITSATLARGVYGAQVRVVSGSATQMLNVAVTVQ